VIQDHIRKIEESLRGGALAPAQREELLRLLAELKSELVALEATRRDAAHEIARLTQAAHEAARGGGVDTQRRRAADRLAESVRDFGASHPKLASIVESIAETLASAGL
jgi:hypothetical protein